jgi:hypothetical protein
VQLRLLVGLDVVLGGAGSAVFLLLALVLALTKGVLDVSVLDYYFVVLPRYLLLLAAILFSVGWIVRRRVLCR